MDNRSNKAWLSRFAPMNTATWQGVAVDAVLDGSVSSQPGQRDWAYCSGDANECPLPDRCLHPCHNPLMKVDEEDGRYVPVEDE